MDSDKEINFEKVTVLLLDVAGTTTSLEYIKKKLFAFIVEESAAFLKKNAEDDTVKTALKELKENDKELDVDAYVELIKKLTNENSDNKNLKTLHGLISKDGYENGTLKAHIYDDVKTVFENWSKDKKIAIYSTGDVESQKLLFSHTVEGNLSAYISNYFDQSVGLKTVPESYTKIVEKLSVKPDQVLFISDDASELTAAKKAGVLTALIKRTGNAEVDAKISKEFTTTVSSFNDLSLELSNKRKIEDAVDGSEVPPTKIAKTEEVVNKPTKVDEVSTESIPEVEKKTTELASSTSEPMEVDSTESEMKNSKEKPDHVSTKDDTPMEAEEIKTAPEPDSAAPVKTGIENLTDKEKKTEADTADSTIVETELKTEKSNSVQESDKIDNLATVEKSTEVDSTEIKVTAENDTRKIEVTESIAEKKETNCVSEDTSEATPKVTESDAKAEKEEINASKDTAKSTEEVKSKAAESNNMPTLGEPKPVESDDTPTTTDSSTEHTTVAEESDEKKVTTETKAEANSKSNEAAVKDNCIKEQAPETKAEESTQESKEESKIEKCVTEKVENKADTKEHCKEEITPIENAKVVETNATDSAKTEKETSNEKTKENGSTDEKQNGTVVSESNPTEEVSNGVVNGQENGNSSKNSNDGEQEESTDIKIKKLEKNVGSPAVAVEV